MARGIQRSFRPSLIDMAAVAIQDIFRADAQMLEWMGREESMTRLAFFDESDKAAPFVGIMPGTQRGTPEPGKTGMSLRVEMVVLWESPHGTYQDPDPNGPDKLNLEPSIAGVTDYMKGLIQEDYYLLRVPRFDMEPLVERLDGFDEERFSRLDEETHKVTSKTIVVAEFSTTSKAWKEIPDLIFPDPS